MPEYWVRIHEPPASPLLRRVQALDPGAVPQALGLPPWKILDIQPVDRSAGPASSLSAFAALTRRPRLQPRLFAQELAVLLDAGVPLLEALQTQREKGGQTPASAVLDAVIDALRDGQPFSVALRRADGEFDELFIALVAASERSGQIATVLRHHAAYLGWSEALRARLVAASVYPALLVFAGGAVVMFLLLFVLPRFAGVFDGMRGDLPAGSRLLMALGVVAAAHPQAALGLALALPAGLVLAWHHGPTRQWVVGLAWRAPGLGPRLRTVALARMYRCVGLLARAGVPVTSALVLAEDVLAPPLRPALRAARAEVAAGQRLSEVWLRHGLTTPAALRMLRVGEGSGELASMLERAAAFHDEEIAQMSELVTRVINPVLMLVMGVVIGGIVVLMYLPIFTIMEQVQ
jgi:general secretion pathway protein F